MLAPNPASPRAASFVNIVVGVLLAALLASLALANLSTGETRSKFAQSRTDMRILARAMEDYHADWNCYPPTYTNGNTFAEGALIRVYPSLTTPVAYLSRTGFVPAFGENVTAPSIGEFGPTGTRPIYMLYNYTSIVENDWAWRAVYLHGAGNPTDAFMVWACGPDKADNALYWAGFGAASPQGAAIYIDLVYDPSNGVISQGDMAVVGGAFPPLMGFESQ